MTDTRAEKLFDRLGIPYEREPDWITKGQRPDFYCYGIPKFWCEVKTLEKLEDSKQAGRALAELRSRTSNISLPGQGIAHVNNNLNHRDAKVVARLVHRAVRRFADSDAPDRTVALIPSDAERSKFVRFSISTKDYAKVEFHSCVSSSGKYGTPEGMFPEPYDQTTCFRFSSGVEIEVLAGNVTKRTDDFRVAIVVYPGDAPFEILTAMLTGAARRLKNPERIRNAVKDANDQLKNATKYKRAPCVVLIFHDGLDVPDEIIIKSALYGNLKYAFMKGNPSDGRLILDRDGAWTPDQNRTTSAIVYIRNDSEPLVIHNYWAHRPLRAGVFACKEVLALSNRRFEEMDFSPTSTATRFDRIRFQARQFARVGAAWLRRA